MLSLSDNLTRAYELLGDAVHTVSTQYTWVHVWTHAVVCVHVLCEGMYALDNVHVLITCMCLSLLLIVCCYNADTHAITGIQAHTDIPLPLVGTGISLRAGTTSSHSRTNSPDALHRLSQSSVDDIRHVDFFDEQSRLFCGN